MWYLELYIVGIVVVVVIKILLALLGKWTTAISINETEMMIAVGFMAVCNRLDKLIKLKQDEKEEDTK